MVIKYNEQELLNHVKTIETYIYTSHDDIRSYYN